MKRQEEALHLHCQLNNQHLLLHLLQLRRRRKLQHSLFVKLLLKTVLLLPKERSSTDRLIEASQHLEHNTKD
jgi:hypothetical protein